MSLWDTAAKDIPRKAVMCKRTVDTVRTRAASTALATPGDELLCTKAGIASGLLNRRTTRNYFAERSQKIQKKIARKMCNLGFEHPPELFRGELHHMPLRAMLENRDLEFAYLDLCSAMNAWTARWIYTELGKSLAEGATVAFTLQRGWRNSQYMRWWCEASRKRGTAAAHLRQRADDLIRESRCTGTVGNLTEFYDDSVTTAADSFSLPRVGTTNWARVLCPEYHDASVDALSAVMLLFSNHYFDLDACIEYRRVRTASAAMVTFVLTDFRRLSEPNISRQLLRKLGENVVPQMRVAAY